MDDSLDRVLRLAGRRRGVLPGAGSFPGRTPHLIPPTPADAKAIMTAHRVDDLIRHLAHAVERVAVLKKVRAPDERRYHSIHLDNHMSGALDQVHGLTQNLRSNYPAEGAELEALKQTIGLARAVGSTQKAATTAHLATTLMSELAHAKRHTIRLLRPEPADAWEFNFSHAMSHVEASHEHAVKIAEHIRDNYPAEAGWLEELQKDLTALAAPAAWPSGKPYRNSLLTLPRDGDGPKTVISAPGAGTFAYGQLRQEPSQTVSPSPPLPPVVKLPTPKELIAFAVKLGKMKDDQTSHHLAGAVLHLESAAVKMTNNPVSALHSLRSAQMAIQDEWRERVGLHKPRIAYAFSINTPPAEQSSQQQQWAKAEAAIGEMQGAASKIAEFIDRVRRAYFGRMGMENNTAGGGLAGQPNARL
jgi:hypothetical protein